MAHEMGHALSLYNTFQGDDANNDGNPDQCPTNTSCTTQGDLVCDTDPHQRSLSNCPSGTNTCGGTPLSNIVTNYMDYSSESCRDRFTANQVTRMRAALTSSFRSSLLTSRALNTTYPMAPYTPPVASCSPNTGPGMSADAVGIMQVTINGSNFVSGLPSQDGGYLDGTTNCMNLVELVRGSTYPFAFTVYGANYEQIRSWIDYNNNGIFDNATEQIYFNASVAPHATDYVTVSGTFTIPVTATLNTPLRLRVVDDGATLYGLPALTGGCIDPQYGQAEDYALFVSAALPITLEYFTGS